MRTCLMERTFPCGLSIPIDDEGIKAVEGVADVKRARGVTWAYPQGSTDNHRTTWHA